MIISMVFFIYTMFMVCFRPTLCYNVVFIFITRTDLLLFLFYWIPTYVYLISIMVFFSFMNKITVRFSLA